MGKLATVMAVLAALIGIAAGVVLSTLTEVQCPPLGICFEAHRFSGGQSAGIVLVAAAAVAGCVGAVRLRRGPRRRGAG